MEAKRFFISNTGAKEQLTVSDELYNYMARVMRLKVGDKVVLCYGDGFDYLGTITEIGKKTLTVKIIKKVFNQNETDIKLTLYQAIPKADKLEIIVQKCSELGVSKIVPFKSVYCAPQGVRIERLNKIAQEAARQCGRATVTEIGEEISFDALLTQLKNGGYDLILHPYENIKEPSLKEVLRKTENAPNNVAVIIGSEGGFSTDEAEQLKSVGALQVTLGPRILRTETAGVVVSGIVMYEFDQMRYNNDR